MLLTSLILFISSLTNPADVVMSTLAADIHHTPALRFGTLLVLDSDSGAGSNVPEEIKSVISPQPDSLWDVLVTKLAEKGVRNLIIYYLDVEGAGPCLFTHYEYVGGGQEAYDLFMKDIKNEDYYKNFITKLQKTGHPSTPVESPNTLWGVLMEEMFHSGQYIVDYAVGDTKPRYVSGVIGLVRDKYIEYKRLHADVWAPVLRRIYASNIRNYVIYYNAATALMFSHFEYVGLPAAFSQDMLAIGEDGVTREWWAVCEPCQRPLKWAGPPPSQGGEGGEGGEWWAAMTLLTQDAQHGQTYLDNQP